MSISSIGGLNIIELGVPNISRSSFGQSGVYGYVKDKNGNHFIFNGSIGNAGMGFFIYPYDTGLGKPNIKDYYWCCKLCSEYIRKQTLEENQKNMLILNKEESNYISNLLGYGEMKNQVCKCCGKKNITDWWFANDFYCSECVEEIKDKFSFKY